MSDLDKNLIPPGPYCYQFLPDNEQPKDSFFPSKIKACPYWKPKDINGTMVPWCDFLNLGGLPGDWGWTDEDWENVRNHYKTKEELDKNLPLFLLFDQCKECGENYDE